LIYNSGFVTFDLLTAKSNTKHNTIMKQNYLSPETEVLNIRFEDALLTTGSYGATSQGFTQKGTYSDDDWDIN